METPLAARDQWIELAKTDRLRGLLKRVAPRIVRIYTLRDFESVLAGLVQVSTGTKTSLSFQDGPVFTRVHRREGPLRLDRFYRATRELGRVFKTEFILDYLSQPALRTRIRRGLLKGEQLHALARCVHYGRLGRLDQRDFERQTGAASCLLLILAAIIYWQIREDRSCFERGGLGCGRSQLRVTVPYQPDRGWDNVLLYGEYQLNRSLVRSERLSV